MSDSDFPAAFSAAPVQKSMFFTGISGASDRPLPFSLQLPEPLVLYRCYNDLIGLAKECQRVIVEEADTRLNNPEGERLGPSVQLNGVILKVRDFLRQLPAANYRTLRFLIAHLHR